MGSNIEVTFVCERCEAKSIVNLADDFSVFDREYNPTKKFAGYEYMHDTVLSIRTAREGVCIDIELSDKEMKQVKLLCPACVSKYEDMLKDIVKKANERVKAFLINKEGGDKE